MLNSTPNESMAKPDIAKRSIIRFGVFELDLSAGELRRNGTKVKIQEQPFQILAALLKRPGEIVTREELRSRLWPADTFVDFDHSLNAAIRRLRDALADDSDNPRFIETVPRRGYRVIAPVNAGAVASPALVAAARPKFLFQLFISVLVVSALVLTISVLYRSNPVRLVPTITPVVTDPGQKKGLALSPDRERVAYSWDGGDGATVSIYVKLIGTPEPLRLTHAVARDFSPVWSRDGRYIAFARVTGGEAGIFVIPALGGAERKLVSTHWDETSVSDLRPRIAWASNGQLLAYSDSPDAGESPCISIISLDSLEPTRLTHAPAGTGGDFNPAFSSDDSSIAFIRDGKEVFNIGFVSVSGGAERLLGPPIMGVTTSMTWDANQMIIANGQLSEFSMVDGKITPLLIGAEAYYPSLRGDRLMFLQRRETINLWSWRLSGHEEPRAITRSTRLTLQPTFSPDGAQLAFVSTRSGAPEIWISRSDGTIPIQLTKFGGAELGAPQWSPNGKQIAFDSRVGKHAHIFLVNSDGGLPRRLMTNANDDADQIVPRWSNDGRWIYYSANSTTEWELWKTPADGGRAMQITHNGGLAAIESHDSNFIYYAKGEKIPGIWRVPAAGGDETQVLDLPQAGYWAYWALVDNGLFYLDAEQADRPSICFFDFATHLRTRRLQLPKPVVALAPGLAVSPDRRTVVYPQLDASYNDIALADKIR